MNPGYTMEYRSVVLSLFLILAISTAVTSVTLPLPSQIVYQFPKPTWVENIVVRPNGQLLVTLVTSPQLWLINPTSPATATLVYTFPPPVLAVLGIAEMEPDVFYVAGGNVTLQTGTHINTWSVFKVDMRFYSLTGTPIVTNVTAIAGAILLNGLARLSKSDNTILIADSVKGGFWFLNIETRAYSFVISDPTMTGNPTHPIPVGADGAKVHGDYLYYTGSDQGIIGRIPVSSRGSATGPAQILSQQASGLDDILVDSYGSVWFTQNYVNKVGVLFTNGTAVDVLGATDQLTVAGVTACAFGRTFGTLNTIYRSTSGGLIMPVNGTITEGGKVVAMNITGFYGHSSR